MFQLSKLIDKHDLLEDKVEEGLINQVKEVEQDD